ncbi:hypothetical protein [Mariniflexile sp.]|uniref:hypothetical protein n=1 Tax=Mariniflexile sp. TaxID=1979402 RepID=UPI0040484DD0
MKNLILIFNLIIVASSCSQNDENKQIGNSIYGTWKLIETYNGTGGGTSQWATIDNGYRYTFNTDNTFTSNRFSECSSGTYELTTSNLILTFDCDGFNTGIESPPGTFVENYAFGDSYLFLTPTYLNCDEGCSNKFDKVE